MSKQQPKFYRLEPRSEFDEAIVRTEKSGMLVYSYKRLLKVVMELNDWKREDAVDWIDFNIARIPNIRIVR
jgi:hypothetical protein